MKITLLSVEPPKEEWFQTLKEKYIKKISHYCKIDVQYVKSGAGDRQDKEVKKKIENKSLLEKIEDTDFVIVFDEKGRAFNSMDFSKKIISGFESGKKRLILLVGGAYGVDEQLKKRANIIVSLSNMTMNHLMAQAVILEQLYRAFTIWKGVPYHNE